MNCLGTVPAYNKPDEDTECMSDMITKVLQMEIDKFLQQNGIYPEKIILDEKSYLLLLEEANTFRLFNLITEYKGVKIESDPQINDWILIAPDHD